MKTIIGITFRHQGKVYYFDPNGETIDRGDAVIVETQQGIEFANVVMGNTAIEDEKITGELKRIRRIATQDDYDQIALNRKNEADAMRICKEKIRGHQLEMKLIKAEYAFDRSRLTFFFTAEGRVDFRDLVKDLASVFRTRIELRQVGVRDESRLIGGLGICGRPLCCATWLPDFVPVSIKMAKEQNLSLNSAKISGVCGRLMCCLKNEAETYEFLNATMPRNGQMVKTQDGETGKVISVDVLRQQATVMIEGEKDEKEIRVCKAEEMIFTKGRKKAGPEESEGEAKNPDEKKSDEKAGGRKSEGRKQENRKSDGRKPEGGRQENKKQDGRRNESGKSEERRADNRKPDEHKSDKRKNESGKSGENRRPDERRDRRDFGKDRRSAENSRTPVDTAPAETQRNQDETSGE